MFNGCSGKDVHPFTRVRSWHNDMRMAMQDKHLSASHPGKAVKGLDDVCGNPCYQSVTEPAALIEACPVTSSNSVASPTGFEPVLPH